MVSGSKLVFSLTAIPPRFSMLGPALESLCAQSVKADEICLFVPEQYQRFSDWDGSLPLVPNGVQIHRVKTDLGPATKILPASQKFKDQDCLILFCDDDRDYPSHWATTFLDAHQTHPEAAICIRGLGADGIAGTTPKRKLQPRAKVRHPRNSDPEYRQERRRRLLRAPFTWSYQEPEWRRFSQSGYIDIFEGCGGVLVRPEMFESSDWEIPKFAWGVDDIWLSGMLARKNVPLWLEANAKIPEGTQAYKSAPLAKDRVGGASRLEANRDTVKYLQNTYGIWLG